MGFEADLIVAVEKRPVIYDKSLSDYKNNNARESAWEDVALEVDRKDVEVLKKRWRSLRDAFIKYQRLEKYYSSGGRGGKKRKWIYYDDMLFLLPYIEHKESSSCCDKRMDASQINNTDDEDETQDGDPINTDIIHSNGSHVDSAENGTMEQQQFIERLNKRKAKHLLAITKTNTMDAKLMEIITKPDDPDEQFLLSCLPVLKRLPPRKNLKARTKILSLLYDIEYWDNYELSEDEESTNVSRPSTSLSNFKTEEL